MNVLKVKESPLMKIYMAVRNPFYKATNPYVSSLMKSIDAQFGDVEWGYGLDVFWTDKIFEYDIVHIHWPHMLVSEHSAVELKKRIATLKERNVKIVSTCHNLEPHYSSNVDYKQSYDIVYANSSVVLHMGMFSLNLLKEKYPLVKHVILPHQTQDLIYKEYPSKEDALNKLGLSSGQRYIICFGLFRNDEERKLIVDLSKKISRKKITILAPSFYRIPKGRNPLRKLPTLLKYLLTSLRYPRIKKCLEYVSDDLLPYFYAAADLALVQRVKILNSGNVPLACLMKKVVVGPDFGNVGLLLDELENPKFDPNDESSIEKAVLQGLEYSLNGKGEKNYEYAKKNFSTAVIASKLYSYYKDSLL